MPFTSAAPCEDDDPALCVAPVEMAAVAAVAVAGAAQAAQTEMTRWPA